MIGEHVSGRQEDLGDFDRQRKEKTNHKRAGQLLGL